MRLSAGWVGLLRTLRRSRWRVVRRCGPGGRGLRARRRWCSRDRRQPLGQRLWRCPRLWVREVRSGCAWTGVAVGRLALSTDASPPSEPRDLGEAELLRLQVGVPKSGDDDQPVTVPLGRLPELEVERIAGRGDHLAVGEDHAAGESAGDVGDDGYPVSISELDRVGGLDVHVGEALKELV